MLRYTLGSPLIHLLLAQLSLALFFLINTGSVMWYCVFCNRLLLQHHNMIQISYTNVIRM